MSDKKPDLPETVMEANPEVAARAGEPQQNYVKMAVDYGPVILFGLTFFACSVFKLVPKTDALIWASGVLAAASVLAVLAGLVLEKRIAWIGLTAAILAVPFAILTVVFKNGIFIKIKMTIIDLLIGSFLLGALAMKKQPLKALLGESLKLRDEAWPKLTVYYALFYFAMAAINEVVWRTQTEGVWVTWKMASMVGGPIVLALCLLPVFMKYMIVPDGPDDKTNRHKR
ncbi:inner membrane-spanning protein YciB [Asticcacaulis solisilvae]|uniref:inner membrane-spanning protein YciB n=1 Tax=Asticcacaulis solisilvae TaxID=1217274 RepID=UPI003FD74EAC